MQDNIKIDLKGVGETWIRFTTAGYCERGN